MARKVSRCRSWQFVFYPESCPSNWFEILDSFHMCFAVSPLHEFDVDENGELKKPHYHCILNFDDVKSFEQIKAISDLLCSPFPVPCIHLGGSVRYLIHMNNPEKYQYNASDITVGGGFNVRRYLDNEDNKKAILYEIYEFIKGSDYTEFYQLTDYAFVNRPDWFDVLLSGYTLFFTNVLKSRRWGLGGRPDSAKKND